MTDRRFEIGEADLRELLERALRVGAMNQNEGRGALSTNEAERGSTPAPARYGDKAWLMAAVADEAAAGDLDPTTGHPEPAPSGWQPIESAPNPTVSTPHDSIEWKSFLVWVESNACTYCVMRRGGKFGVMGGGLLHHEPTHWMPLPPAPWQTTQAFVWHTCHDMNPPFPGPCCACETEAAQPTDEGPHAKDALPPAPDGAAAGAAAAQQRKRAERAEEQISIFQMNLENLICFYQSQGDLVEPGKKTAARLKLHNFRKPQDAAERGATPTSGCSCVFCGLWQDAKNALRRATDASQLPKGTVLGSHGKTYCSACGRTDTWDECDERSCPVRDKPVADASPAKEPR